MLYVHGIGHFHPENVIDNTFLESLDIGTDDVWIMERVGIRTRRTVLSLDYIRHTLNRDPRAAKEASSHQNQETGALAAKMAMSRAGVTAADIGLVLAGGCSPQWLIPAEACLIAAELGIEAPCLDVSSACSTFAAQIDFLRRCSPDALPEHVLIVQPENTTRTVDYGDRRGAVLWGDASTAAVISAKRPARVRVAHASLHSDPKGWDKVRIPSGGHFEQDGRAVQGFAIRKGASTFLELAERSARGPHELYFVGHQANLLVLEGICRRAEIESERHLYNVQDYGNCGAAGAPSVLSERWDTLAEGDELALVVVGSGLTWGGVLLQIGAA